MVLCGPVIPQYLVRLARAPTRHQTQNPGLGKMSPNSGSGMHKKNGFADAVLGAKAQTAAELVEEKHEKVRRD